SRSVVSKISTRSMVVSFTPARPGKHLGPRTARPVAPDKKKPRGAWSRPWHPLGKGEGSALHASEGRGRAAKQQAQGRSKECGLLEHLPERLAALSGLVKHDRAHRWRLGAGGGLQRVSGQTAHEGHERPGERIAPDAEEEHHL